MTLLAARIVAQMRKESEERERRAKSDQDRRQGAILVSLAEIQKDLKYHTHREIGEQAERIATIEIGRASEQGRLRGAVAVASLAGGAATWLLNKIPFFSGQ